MNQIVPLRLRFQKDIVTRVVRKLGAKGVFKIRAGQEIAPDEIIGNAVTASGFRTVNIASELHVSPQEGGKYLAKEMNTPIFKGELLAFKKGGIFGGKKILVSPTDGTLEFLNPKTGELKISFFPKKINLPSGVYGIVEEVDSQRGQAIIRTTVSQIKGVFGTGKSREGLLHILGKNDDLITKDALKNVYDEHILVGGSLFFKDAISSAISQGVKGLISGGINASDYKAMASGHLDFPKKFDNDIGISIIVTEGFGAVPAGEDIFSLLSGYEGKFVFIDGNKATLSLPSFFSSSLTKVRKVVFPKNRQEEEPALMKAELKVGAKVRIVGNSYFGMQGIISAINNSQTLLPSEIKANLAIVETSRKKIEVPVANLEGIV